MHHWGNQKPQVEVHFSLTITSTFYDVMNFSTCMATSSCFFPSISEYMKPVLKYVWNSYIIIISISSTCWSVEKFSANCSDQKKTKERRTSHRLVQNNLKTGMRTNSQSSSETAMPCKCSSSVIYLCESVLVSPRFTQRQNERIQSSLVQTRWGESEKTCRSLQYAPHSKATQTLTTFLVRGWAPTTKL